MVALEPIIASTHGRGESSPIVIVTAHKGGDVTVAGWQVGQQVAHFRDAPSFLHHGGGVIAEPRLTAESEMS